MPHKATPQNKQHGVALITALLIVALATITAVAMTSRQQIDIRRSANVLNLQQARAYTLGAEAWAQQILWRDARSSSSDHLQELWAMTLPPTMVEGGQLSGRLSDLQSQFNLNNLLKADGSVSELDVQRLQRLLTYLELPEELIAVMIDWIDSDTDPTLPNGAEDNSYLLKDPAYRAANQLFSSVSELRLLHGMTDEIFQQLRLYITVLPQRTALNVNTMPAALLLSLSDSLTSSDVEMLIAARTEKPAETVSEWLAQDALAGLDIKTEGLSVNSKYFLLHAEAQIDTAYAQLFSVLNRRSDVITVIRRAFDPVDYLPAYAVVNTTDTN